MPARRGRTGTGTRPAHLDICRHGPNRRRRGMTITTKTENRRLRRRAIPGSSKSASVMACGFDSFRTLEDAAPILDTFHAAGGNMFDTAWVYGHGVPEDIFGEWHSRLGIRDEIVLISKGAHSPL